MNLFKDLFNIGLINFIMTQKKIKDKRSFRPMRKAWHMMSRDKVESVAEQQIIEAFWNTIQEIHQDVIINPAHPAVSLEFVCLKASISLDQFNHFSAHQDYLCLEVEKVERDRVKRSGKNPDDLKMSQKEVFTELDRAYHRLCGNQPIRLPEHSPVSRVNVAKEANLPYLFLCRQTKEIKALNLQINQRVRQQESENIKRNTELLNQALLQIIKQQHNRNITLCSVSVQAGFYPSYLSHNGDQYPTIISKVEYAQRLLKQQATQKT